MQYIALVWMLVAVWKRMFIIYLAKKELLARVLGAVEAKVFTGI